MREQKRQLGGCTVSKNSGTVVDTSFSTRSGVLVDIEYYIPWVNGYSIKDIQDLQRSDPDIGQVCRWKLDSPRVTF